jgi:hypothetical protein
LDLLIPFMHARIATKALDAAEQIGEDDWDDKAGTLFLALAPLLEAAVHLSGSEPLAQRWRTVDLISLLDRRVNVKRRLVWAYRLTLGFSV